MNPTTQRQAEEAIADLFGREFQDLVQRYAYAARGLDVDRVKALMRGRARVHTTRHDRTMPDEPVVFVAWQPGGTRANFALAAALDTDGALEVGTRDETLFVRKDGEWVPIND
jgi:hypothetical protein